MKKIILLIGGVQARYFLTGGSPVNEGDAEPIEKVQNQKVKFLQKEEEYQIPLKWNYQAQEIVNLA